MMTKKGISLSLETIVVALIALIVLILLIAFFGKSFGVNVGIFDSLTSCSAKKGSCEGMTSDKTQPDDKTCFPTGDCNKDKKWCCISKIG